MPVDTCWADRHLLGCNPQAEGMVARRERGHLFREMPGKVDLGECNDFIPVSPGLTDRQGERAKSARRRGFGKSHASGGCENADKIDWQPRALRKPGRMWSF